MSALAPTLQAFFTERLQGQGLSDEVCVVVVMRSRCQGAVAA